jgi:hypothetical protein
MNYRSRDSSQPTSLLKSGALILMLLVRGVLLWIVVPISVAWWLIGLPINALTRRPLVGLSQAIGWADLNLIALLTLGHQTPFVSWSQASKVTHRVGWLDPA